MTKHLYIHIPFCNSICKYCDFLRFDNQDIKVKEKYIYKICNQIEKESKLNQYTTIYIGGGTPNSLSNNLLIKLLSTCKKYLDKKYEFTIECNPECLNIEQTKIFKKYGINRVSLGAQILNNKILKLYNRKHSVNDVILAVKLLKKFKISNISCDFIYGFNEMNNKDLISDFNFIKKYNIPHFSFYSLEVKENSFISKNEYKINENNISDQFEKIINHFKNSKWKRYETSSWSLKNKQSLHNKAYWESKDWKAIGLGAYGFEKQNYYFYKGNLNNYKKINKKLNKKDLYFQIISMGLRLVSGIDLNVIVNKKAYFFYKNKLKDVKIVNKHLISKNLNILDNELINLL